MTSLLSGSGRMRIPTAKVRLEATRSCWSEGMVDCRDPDAGRQRRLRAARLCRRIVADPVGTGLMFVKSNPLRPMKPKSLLPTLAAAMVLSTATGCFNYVPTEIGAVPPGESVRLYLTRAGVDAVNEAGNEEALSTVFEPVLSGEFVRRTGDDLFLRVPTVRRQIGFHSAQLGQDIRVPASEIVQIERQELSRAKTGRAGRAEPRQSSPGSSSSS